MLGKAGTVEIQNMITMDKTTRTVRSVRLMLWIYQDFVTVKTQTTQWFNFKSPSTLQKPQRGNLITIGKMWEESMPFIWYFLTFSDSKMNRTEATKVPMS